MIDPLNPDFDNTPVSPGRPACDYATEDTKAEPVVTIVTPFYNVGAVFHETARCVLRQSLQRFEWIIVNDGSTDRESLSVLDHYRNIDPRVRVIDHQVNRGPSAARNTGFKAARADYVLPLDGDDLLEPTTAEKWFWFLTTHPEFSFVNSYSVGFGFRRYLWQKGFHSRCSILQENPLTYCCLARKNAHFAVGGYDETIRAGGEDWEYWVRCADRGYWGYTLPEYLFWYRTRQNFAERWPNLQARGLVSLAKRLSHEHPRLLRRPFPVTRHAQRTFVDSIPGDIPAQNVLHHSNGKARLMMIVPWMSLGGADKFNLELIGQLAKRGWEITLATTLDNPQISWYHEFSRLTPDVFVLPRFLQSADQPRFIRYLIESRKPDLVLISNSELAYLCLPILRRWCPDTPVVDYCHSEVEGWKDGGYPALSTKYRRYLDLTIVSSNHLKKWMARRGCDPERIEVCYIGADAERWRPDSNLKARTRRELLIDDNTPLILFAGRLAPEKQPTVFARVMRNLKESGMEFCAVLAGDGPEKATIESYLHKSHLSGRVKLLGSVTTERVRELMAAADIFFLPSKYEGIALTLYEAMAAGLAVVAANAGGQNELITEGCGILVNPGDQAREIREYTEILARLISDRSERESLGKNARGRVEAFFRLEDMGTRMVELFEKATSLHSLNPIAKHHVGQSDHRELIEYVNAYVAPNYFRSDVGGIERAALLFGQARRYYRSYGASSTLRMAAHYVTVNTHGLIGVLDLKARAFVAPVAALYEATRRYYLAHGLLATLKRIIEYSAARVRGKPFT